MASPVKRSMTIAAPPSKVLQVVLDFDQYASWQKEIESATVIERDDEGRPAKVKLVASAMGMKANSVIALAHAPNEVSWHLVEGDMITRNDSHYVLRENAKGGTDIELEMMFELKWNLPSFMIDNIIAKGVNDNLKAVKRAAEAD